MSIKSNSWEKTIERLLFVGLVLLIVTSTMNGLTFDLTLGTRSITIRPDQIALVLLLPILALAYFKPTHGGRLRWHRTKLDLPVLGLLLINLLSSLLFSPVKAASLQGVFLMAIYVAVYFVTANLLLQYPHWSLRVMTIFLIAGIAHAIYGLLSLLAYSWGWDIGGIFVGHVGPESVSISSTFVEPNLLGIYLAVVGTFFSVLAIFCQRRRDRWLAAGGLVLVAWALILTVTRSSWLAFGGIWLVLVVVALVQTRGLLKAAARLAPLLLAAVLIFGTSWLVLDPLLSELWGQEDVLASRFSPLADLLPDENQTADDLEAGKPTQESAGQPAKEDVGQPAQEGVGQPTQEDASQPAQEGAGQPTQEDAGQPAQEGIGQPTQESAGQPTQEDAGQPAEEGMYERLQALREQTQEVEKRDQAEVESLITAAFRIELFKLGLQEWLKAPFLGHGTFAGETIGHSYWIGSLIQSLYDTGAVGAIFLLWFYGLLILSPGLAYIRSLRGGEQALPMPYRNGLLAFALANVVLAFTSQFSSFLWVGFPWVFAGLTVGFLHASRTPPAGAGSPADWNSNRQDEGAA